MLSQNLRKLPETFTKKAIGIHSLFFLRLLVTL